jgi:hypothetical protein
MEGKERCAHVEGFGREPVEEKCSGGECVSPIGGRHRGLEEKSASNVIEGTKSAFGFAILLRGVGA